MTDDRKPTEAELLAPWATTGKLTEAEDAVVRDAMVEDDFRTFMELTDEERHETHMAAEALGRPSRASFDALMSEIDAMPARQPSLMDRLSRAFGSFGFTSKPAIAAFGALALAVAVQMGVIVNLNGDAPPDFTTATGPATEIEAVLLVGFAPTASVGDVSELLDTLDAEILSGPAAGMYRVGFATQGAAADALAELQGNPDLVMFAAPGE